MLYYDCYAKSWTATKNYTANAVRPLLPQNSIHTINRGSFSSKPKDTPKLGSGYRVFSSKFPHYPFQDHPFRVVDDEAMQRTVESIAQFGVLSPAIARPRLEGGYELISGHRRHHVSVLAGKETMPVIVRNLNQDEATIFMVDSNLQRETILPSEQAKAYKMKLEAMSRQGERMDLTCGQIDHKSSDTNYMKILPDNAKNSRLFLNTLTYTIMVAIMKKRRDSMTAITATKAKENMYQLIQEVNDNCVPVIITNNEGKNAVLIGEEDWRAIEETLYLVSIPGMAESIINGGNTPLEDCMEESEVW